ncbi:MAG: GGDEF domain-containing protein [Halieaceae bacterium]
MHPNAVLRLVLPAVFMGLAVLGRNLLVQLSEEQLKLASLLPYLLATVSVVLAYQFNRMRFILLALFTGGGFWVIQNHLQVSLAEPEAVGAFKALAFAWPLMILLLLLFPERGIWNRYGLIYTLAIGVLALAAPRLSEMFAMLLVDYGDWMQIWPRPNFVMPLAAAAVFLFTFVLGLALLLWRDDETEVALLASLGAGYIVLGGFHLSFISLVMFVVAGLIQVSSILRSSHAMAYRDDLTGLLGRRALNERLNGLGPRYSLAMLDVDHFKKFNDTHGHDVGDEVLKMVAARIAKVGGGGTAFRYGGEEFVVVFPRRGAEQCVDALEAIRESVADYRMTLRDKGQRPVKTREGERKRGNMATKIQSGTVAVTISLGLAERTEDLLTPEEVIKAADQQLYRAKQAGRNKLCY